MLYARIINRVPMESNEQTGQKKSARLRRQTAIAKILDDLDPTGRRKRNWGVEAACLDESPDTFYVDGSSGKDEKLQKAKDICRTCPVAKICLAFAFESDTHDYYVMGGMIGSERKAMLGRYIAGFDETVAAPPAEAEIIQTDSDQAVA